MGEPLQPGDDGAVCSLVEIGVLTRLRGHTLLSTEMVLDVGQAIDIANIEAGFIQGYGLEHGEHLQP